MVPADSQPRSTAGSRASPGPPGDAFVDLYWLPLGAGGHVVRWNGRLFEVVDAAVHRRPPLDLYHSALEVGLRGDRYVIEQGPAWGLGDRPRGVVRRGPVGLRPLGRIRLFRYEVRCWRDGVIPDVSAAVASPLRLSRDAAGAGRLLDLVHEVPEATWGRDEQRTGEMWNSNSVVSWLLARSGHHTDGIAVPPGGRAPGWAAGLVVAARQSRGSPDAVPQPGRGYAGRSGRGRPRRRFRLSLSRSRRGR